MLATQQRLEGLTAVHSYAWSQGQQVGGATILTSAEWDALPPVEHPVVRTHPATGRKNLYVGRHASHVVGMEVERGRALLAAVDGRRLPAAAPVPPPVAARRSGGVGQPLRAASRASVAVRGAAGDEAHDGRRRGRQPVDHRRRGGKCLGASAAICCRGKNQRRRQAHSWSRRATRCCRASLRRTNWHPPAPKSWASTNPSRRMAAPGFTTTTSATRCSTSVPAARRLVAARSILDVIEPLLGRGLPRHRQHLLAQQGRRGASPRRWRLAHRRRAASAEAAWDDMAGADALSGVRRRRAHLPGRLPHRMRPDGGDSRQPQERPAAARGSPRRRDAALLGPRGIATWWRRPATWRCSSRTSGIAECRPAKATAGASSSKSTTPAATSRSG